MLKSTVGWTRLVVRRGIFDGIDGILGVGKESLSGSRRCSQRLCLSLGIIRTFSSDANITEPAARDSRGYLYQHLEADINGAEGVR